MSRVVRGSVVGALAVVVVTTVPGATAQAAGGSAPLSLSGSNVYQYIQLADTVTVPANSVLQFTAPPGISGFDSWAQASNWSLFKEQTPTRKAGTDLWTGTVAPPQGEYDAFLPGSSPATPGEYAAFRFHLVVTDGTPTTTTLDLAGGSATRFIDDAAPEATVTRGNRFTYTAPDGVDLTGSTVRLGRNVKAGESSIVFSAQGDLHVVATATSVSFTVPDPVVIDHEDDAPEIWDTYGDQRLLAEITVPGSVPTAIGTGTGVFRTALITEKDLPFTDVPGDGQFTGDIGWLVQQGITGGYKNGTFKPSGAVSREAMAAFLYRYADEPAFTAPANPTFTDVPTTSAFYREVEWLASTGVSTGTVQKDWTKVFKPSSPVSRQAMAAFLHRFSALP